MKIINKTIYNDTSIIPIGCSVYVDDNDNIVDAIYNSASESKKQCSVSKQMYGNIVADITNVNVTLEIDEIEGNISFVRSPAGYTCKYNVNNVLKSFPTTSNSNESAINALNECENYCRINEECKVCAVYCTPMNPADKLCEWHAIPLCGPIIKVNTMSGNGVGLISGDISTKNEGVINITISGPSNVWFGCGFNAQQMSDQPWTIIINSTDVWEQKIGTCNQNGDHCPGITLNKTIKVLSQTVNTGIRTVKIQRSLIGANWDYYSFKPYAQGSINLITAIGQSQEFAYHKAHSSTIISLYDDSGNNNSTCICDIGANGKLCENDGSQCRQFIKDCIGYSTSSMPSGSLIKQNNPTCNSTTYSGGMSCCINGHNLLDPDQEIPSQLLKYHIKVRFWFTEYYPANKSNPNPSHYNLERIYQQTEANAAEYDIPPAFLLPNESGIVGYPQWKSLTKPTPGTHCTGNCPNGNDCECYHEISLKWIQSTDKPMRLIYYGGHCHAPACISMTLYRNDTGEILCQQKPIYGQGNITNNKFDEAGYILIPPCLWGNDIGLEPSILLPPGTPLLSVKKDRNTHQGHYGEMASVQMRGVYF